LSLQNKYEKKLMPLFMRRRRKTSMPTAGNVFGNFFKAWMVRDNDRSREEKDSGALLEAAARCHVDIVNSLLSEGADVHAKDNHDRTALMYATWEGRTETVKLLLSNGADANSKDRRGRTALLLATENGDLNIVEHCLKRAPPWTRMMKMV
jgi:hypothetical protein